MLCYGVNNYDAHLAQIVSGIDYCSEWKCDVGPVQTRLQISESFMISI